MKSHNIQVPRINKKKKIILKKHLNIISREPDNFAKYGMEGFYGGLFLSRKKSKPNTISHSINDDEITICAFDKKGTCMGNIVLYNNNYNRYGHCSRKKWFVQIIAVKKAYRRQGVGFLLMLYAYINFGPLEHCRIESIRQNALYTRHKVLTYLSWKYGYRKDDFQNEKGYRQFRKNLKLYGFIK